MLRSPWFLVICVTLAVGSAALPVSAAEPAAIVKPVLEKFEKIELPPGTPAVAGMVKLILHINVQGKVEKVELQEGVGEPYDGAVQRAARGFRYRPATRDGKPLGIRLVVEVPVNARTVRGGRRPRLAGPTRNGRRTAERSPGYHYAGRVLEKGTRTPLAGVMVLMRDRRFGREQQTVTDRDGGFSFDGLAPGAQQLEIITTGHDNKKETIRPVPRPEGDAVVVADPFYLAPNSFAGHRTIVVDTQRKEAASEIRLTEDELTMTPGTMGDPTRVIQTLPGVSRSPFGLGYYIVRGASFENTGFFIDGHPAFLLYHFFGGPGVIHPELVGSIAFYPGGYPAKYGRFATGAIVLETKDPPADRWHLDLEIDVLKASVLFSIPFDEGKGQFTVSARQSYYEFLLPLFTSDINVGFTDYQLRLNYQFTPKLKARLLLLGSEDRFWAKGGSASTVSSTAQTSFNLGFHRVLGAVDLELSRDWDFNNSMVFEYDHTSNVRTAEEADDIDVQLGGWFLQLRSWAEYAPSKTFKFEAGLDAFYARFDADLTIPILPPIGDPEPPVFTPITVRFQVGGPYISLAPYAMADWEVVPGLRLLPGVRLNIEKYTGPWHTTFDPRLNIRWEFIDGWTMKAMSGIAHQPPAAFQVVEPFGDPDIPPVSGTQGSFGFEWEPAKDWEITLEGFVNYMSNIARPTDGFDTSEGGLQRVLWTSDVKGRAYGMELLIRKRFGGRVYGWLSYTLARAERLYPPNDWTQFNSDQTHIMNLAATVKLPGEFSLGARFTLTSGNPFYPVVGSRYDADRDRYVPVFSSQTDRLPFFHRLDVRLDRRWRFDTWMMEAYLDIQNAYNASNPEFMVYSYDYSETGTGVSFPFLPTLGVRALF